MPSIPKPENTVFTVNNRELEGTREDKWELICPIQCVLQNKQDGSVY
jgi:hypothetical protein